MEHAPLVQQSTYTHVGEWWVSCCNRIITRVPLTDDSWCPTQEDAEAMAAWHVAGEAGLAPAASAPGPAGPPVQLSLFVPV
ncbi:hypothetical protein GCM10010193_69790 [Kitasatospora atroaurantiaca]|uniref:Uncharacterized protein n=1 Tax=Kitasatospora atroaurantiaca TaxID=285545 RepID=A0A561EN73_9ACTN|nr:hypothetical protein [Kitasatospora atroaurantiaca]TWE17065.1 hypothetical protein FB465_2069 [Kitasatospora atroaurantiaca]